MAEIMMKYDTKSKELSVTKDGKAMENVHQISVSKNWPGIDEDGNEQDRGHGLHILTVDKSTKDEGYLTHTHTMANERGDVIIDRTEKVPANSTGHLITKYLRRGG